MIGLESDEIMEAMHTEPQLTYNIIQVANPQRLPEGSG